MFIIDRARETLFRLVPAIFIAVIIPTVAKADWGCEWKVRQMQSKLQFGGWTEDKARRWWQASSWGCDQPWETFFGTKSGAASPNAVTNTQPSRDANSNIKKRTIVTTAPDAMTSVEREAYVQTQRKQAERDKTLDLWASSQGDGSQAATTAKMSIRPKNTRKGIPINPATREPCVKITSAETIPLESGGRRYNYTFENSCQKTYNVSIINNGGGTSYVDVRPSKPAHWFCTDGVRVNSDCKGGIASISF